MATAAQIEANRRKSALSTGPRTEFGKSRSRLNSLDHGFRANLLVLPTEDREKCEAQARGLKETFRPRNSFEEMLVDRLAFLTLQTDRINHAHTARISMRMRCGEVHAADSERKRAIRLGQRLFQEPGAPQAESSRGQTRHSRRFASTRGSANSCSIDDDPGMLVARLQENVGGCEWMLDQWAALRELLDRGVPWLASDQRRAVRLLGEGRIGVLFSSDAARVYLAGHMLLGQEGNPFQAVLDELTPDQAMGHARSLQLREFGLLAPKDAAAARQMLREIVDRATEPLEEKVEVLRELAEANGAVSARALAWDHTPEGQRLRRYQTTFERAWFRTFDLLMKVRRTGGDLDLGTIESFHRGAVSGSVRAIERPAPIARRVGIPPVEPAKQPAAPNEAKSERVIAPNEANSHVQAPSPALCATTGIKTSESTRRTSTANRAGRGQPALRRAIRSSTGCCGARKRRFWM